MRKTTIAALSLAITLGASGAASAQSSEPRPPRERAGQMERQRGGRGGGPEQMLLKGITLSEQQKTRIQALHKADSANGSREQFRKAMTEAREARERGDTVTAKARMSEVRKQMDAQREQRIASLRSVLNADQQKQFDANLAEWKQRAEQHRGGQRRG